MTPPDVSQQERVVRPGGSQRERKTGTPAEEAVTPHARGSILSRTQVLGLIDGHPARAAVNPRGRRRPRACG